MMASPLKKKSLVGVSYSSLGRPFCGEGRLACLGGSGHAVQDILVSDDRRAAAFDRRRSGRSHGLQAAFPPT